MDGNRGGCTVLQQEERIHTSGDGCSVQQEERKMITAVVYWPVTGGQDNSWRLCTVGNRREVAV